MRGRLGLVVAFALGMLLVPLTADAQQAGKVARIGFLGGRSPSDMSPLLDAFRQGLRELGWVEGQNIVIDYRFAEGRFDRLPDLAAELVRLKVDVIVAQPTPATAAAKNATETIPIVMISVGDPVGLGLIASLARPAGNATGLSYSVGLETLGKGLELLKETVPKVRRVAILSNPANPAQPLAIKRSERRGPVVGSAASTPGGPRSQRIRRRIRGDGHRARGSTPRSGRWDVHPPPNTARRPRSKEPPAGSIRP
jgi:putative ABC transport system substrate-binding protein